MEKKFVGDEIGVVGHAPIKIIVKAAGKPVDKCVGAAHWRLGILFDDMIATGGSISRFAEKLRAMGASVIGALALGKKISDGYDQKI